VATSHLPTIFLRLVAFVRARIFYVKAIRRLLMIALPTPPFTTIDISSLLDRQRRIMNELVDNRQRYPWTFRHGMRYTKAYRCWQGMKNRCLNPRNKDYRKYGGRGITVCDRWMKFENFFADMGKPPPGMTLDRRDNDGSYSPENCRWVLPLVQQNNQRTNRFIAHDGEIRTISQWARHLGVPDATLRTRIRRQWPIDEVLSK